MSFPMQLATSLVIVLSWFLYPIFAIVSLFRRRCKILPVKNPLLLLSAKTLSEKIRKKELSSYDVVQAYIQRVVEVNSVINAVVDERFQSALQDARQIDEYLQLIDNTDDLAVIKPLLGVPVTIKESCAVKGLTQSVGHLAFKGRKAEIDCGAVKKLRDADAIPILVSIIPEYCVGIETNNLLLGTAKNPYNTKCTTGGSSGGEAALLASAASIVGIGSDCGGSIRIPALFNGVFGHKPTSRIVPSNGHFPASEDESCYDYFAIGPMTRYAEDLKLMMKSLIVDSNYDLDLDLHVDLSTLNLFYMENLGYWLGINRVQSSIIRSMKKCVDFLVLECDMTLRTEKFKGLKNATAISTSIFFNVKYRPNFLADPKDPTKNLSFIMQLLKSPFGKSEISANVITLILLDKINAYIPQKKLLYYMDEMLKLKAELINELKTNGVLLFPTFPCAAFGHNLSYVKCTGTPYTLIWNVLGFPTTHVPLGLDNHGLPIGIQVIAAPFQDRLCLAVAEALERKFGGWIPPFD